MTNPQEEVSKEWNAMAGETGCRVDVVSSEGTAKVDYSYCTMRSTLPPSQMWTNFSMMIAKGEWDDLAVGYRDGLVKILESLAVLDFSCGTLTVLDFGCGTGLLTEVLQNKVSQVICVDAASLMVEQVNEKIRAREWKDVNAYCVALAYLDEAQESVRQEIQALYGKVDFIFASSALSFIPQEDLAETMRVLGSLLRPNGGILCHSDWPQSENHPDGLTEESAMRLYEMAGLEKKSTTIASNDMMGQECPVFVGVAEKA